MKKFFYFSTFFSFSVNPDPRGYQTVWGCFIGNIFSFMSSWTVGQATVQRVVAARSLKDAKK